LIHLIKCEASLLIFFNFSEVNSQSSFIVLPSILVTHHFSSPNSPVFNPNTVFSHSSLFDTSIFCILSKAPQQQASLTYTLHPCSKKLTSHFNHHHFQCSFSASLPHQLWSFSLFARCGFLTIFEVSLQQHGVFSMSSWTSHCAAVTVIFVSGAKVIFKSITAPCCWCEPKSVPVADLAGINPLPSLMLSANSSLNESGRTQWSFLQQNSSPT